jgi:hypothetical protein
VVGVRHGGLFSLAVSVSRLPTDSGEGLNGF